VFTRQCSPDGNDDAEPVETDCQAFISDRERSIGSFEVRGNDGDGNDNEFD
jgi:hypothetical protein